MIWAKGGGRGRMDDHLNPCLEVELCDRSLPARVRGLVVDAFAVALHLGQVLVEDLTRSQRRHQVVKLAAIVLPVGLRFPRLAFPLPLLFELVTEIRTNLTQPLFTHCAVDPEHF